jgi:tetratricopeptide (TPR) repeat protein
MGKVKLRVRENALRMREFTVEQMIKATGFNQESVQSELRRMRVEGLLTVPTRVPTTQQRGAPPCLYRLTSDPEARLELASQIEDFFSKPKEHGHPTSQHYFEAVKLLDQMETNEVDKTIRRSLIDSANEELDFAWNEEGEPSGSVDAYIKCQLGRLEYIRGNYNQAEELFLRAQRLFEASGDIEQRSCGQEYLSALSVRRQWDQKRHWPADETSLVSRTEAAVMALQKSHTTSLPNHPISELLVNLVKELLAALKESMRDLIIAEATAQLAHRIANTSTSARSIDTSELQIHRNRVLFPLGMHTAAPEMEDWSVQAEPVAWTHNLPDDYQYALRSYSVEPLEFLALNSALGKGGHVTSVKTELQLNHWAEPKR